MKKPLRMPNWDPEAYKKSIQQHTDKTLSMLKSKGVEVELEDENPNLNNLRFTQDGKSIKMSHHSFYRYAGRGMKAVSVGKNDYKFVALPINEYMQNLIVPIILHRLKSQ